jgi:hypothetical protein
MGSIAFDFLSGSFLLNEDCIAAQYEDYSEDQIAAELEAYRSHCLQHFDPLIDDVKNTESTLKVVARDHTLDTTRLLQGALYLENYVIYDPLFALTTPETKIQKSAKEFYGANDTSIRESVLSVIPGIKSIQPLVAGDYVKLLPLSHYFEPTDTSSIYYSGMEYAPNALDPNVRQYFFDNLKLDTLENINGEWFAMQDIDRSRHAVLGFGDSDFSMQYQYFDIVPRNKNHDPDKIYAALERDAAPPPQEEFEEWLRWCLFSSSLALYTDIQKHSQVASQLNALPIVSSQFESGLLRLGADPIKNSASAVTTESLLNIELPFFDRIDPEKLLRLRQSDGILFNNFRNKLESYFKEARSMTNREDLERLNREIDEEIMRKDLPLLRQKISNVSLRIGGNIALAGMSLFAAIQQHQFSWLPTAIGGLQAYNAALDYKSMKIENPMYFLHRILRK